VILAWLFVSSLAIVGLLVFGLRRVPPTEDDQAPSKPRKRRQRRQRWRWIGRQRVKTSYGSYYRRDR